MKVKSGGETVQLSLEKIGQVGRFLGCGLVAGIKKGKVKWGKCPAVCIHRLHFRIRKMAATAEVKHLQFPGPLWALMVPRYASGKGQTGAEQC